jgi:GNAT superfamily N-acetyltransferase
VITAYSVPQYEGLDIRTEVSAGMASVWAVEDGATVGSLVWAGEAGLDDPEYGTFSPGEIISVSVAPEWQGNGLGRFLLETARAMVDYPIVHSGQKTLDGAGWAARVGAWEPDEESQRQLDEIADMLSKPYTSPDREPILPPAHELYGGFIQEGSDHRLYLDGKPVEKLYRVADPGEWADALRNGYLQSSGGSGGYTRASAQPDERWRRQGPSNVPAYTLEIDYDPADNWHASAEGYAATHARIPLSRVRKVGSKTAMPWTEGPDDSTRCTQTVLMQFGIFDRAPRDGLGMLETLMKHGWTYAAVDDLGSPFRGTVKQFYEDPRFQVGSYYIVTSGHAMAMVDGLLVDSEGRGPDGRHVIAAFEVYRPGSKTAATSWRPFTAEPFWLQHDVVISSEGGASGRKQYEINVKGRPWANKPTLSEAKAAVEAEFGQLAWRSIRPDKVEVEHYYFGPSVEWTSPVIIWAAELP